MHFCGHKAGKNYDKNTHYLQRWFIFNEWGSKAWDGCLHYYFIIIIIIIITIIMKYSINIIIIIVIIVIQLKQSARVAELF